MANQIDRDQAIREVGCYITIKNLGYNPKFERDKKTGSYRARPSLDELPETVIPNEISNRIVISVSGDVAGQICGINDRVDFSQAFNLLKEKYRLQEQPFEWDNPGSVPGKIFSPYLARSRAILKQFGREGLERKADEFIQFLNDDLNEEVA